VDVASRNRPGEVRAHYGRLCRWWIKLSDWEAVNVGFIRLLFLGLVMTALLRCSRRPRAAAEEGCFSPAVGQ
jgi:hypothetical protein